MDDEGRLADAVRSRRTELMLSQIELATNAGLSDSTVRSIESGRRTSLRASNRRALAQALGWTPDSIDRIRAGDEPVLVEQTPPVLHSIDDPVIRARLDDLERRVTALERERQAPETTPAAERHRAKRAAARPS